MMPKGIFIKTLPHFPHVMATFRPPIWVWRKARLISLSLICAAKCQANQPPIAACLQPSALLSEKCMPDSRQCAPCGGKCLWKHRAFPLRPSVRMYAGQYNVMEGVQEIAPSPFALAAASPMLKTMPLGAHVPRQPLRRFDAALHIRNHGRLSFVHTLRHGRIGCCARRRKAARAIRCGAGKAASKVCADRGQESHPYANFGTRETASCFDLGHL